MKIRNGFVSNSSSSSFCAIGTYVSLYDDASIKKLAKDVGVTIEDEERSWEAIDIIVEKFESMTKSTGFSVYRGEEGIYLGLEYSNLKDDETGGEFKVRAQKIADENLKGIPGKLSFFNEEIYC